MRGTQVAVKQDKLFTVQKDMKKDVEAQLAKVLDQQKSSQEALLAALTARLARVLHISCLGKDIQVVDMWKLAARSAHVNATSV